VTLSGPSGLSPSSAFDAAVNASRLAGDPLNVAPTDLSQFVRLGQCQRYLRLRLHEQNDGTGFFKAIDADPVPLPAVLTKSGLEFEQRVEAEIIASIPSYRFAGGGGRRAKHDNDNLAVIEFATDLAPGDRFALLQPKLSVEIAGWRLSGLADLVLLSRDLTGALEALTVDFKSSKVARLEHRLQVAIYRLMLGRLFDENGLDDVDRPIAILYRGGSTPVEGDEDRRTDALRTLGVSNALLDRVLRPAELDDAAHDLLLARSSLARRVVKQDFESIPFHLTNKCDGCLYNEVCLKWCAVHDDLSLIPQLSEQDKTVLRREGIETAGRLAAIKTAEPSLAADLATTWPVGSRMDELIARAQRYRQWRGEDYRPGQSIPDSGHGSLPFSSAEQNPNLVRVYLDVQHDYLHDRIYLAGSLISAANLGIEAAPRRRSVVHISDGPPDTDEKERALLEAWINETITAIVELAALDAEGEPKAPIHLIFFERGDQRVLLEALGRHAAALLNATPLFDFVTQLAAYDSPIATFLSEEVRAHRNYPMICQSLQSVAMYLKFDWDAPLPFRTLFRKRMFDYLGRLKDDALPAGDTVPWFTRQARFSSGLPLEYAYAAWGALDQPDPAFAAADVDLIVDFEVRRLEAIEHVAKRLPENTFTAQRTFELPDLANFQCKANTLAEALSEFLTLERHAALSQWKSARLPSPERRFLAGTSLIVRYLESDQEPAVASVNRENLRRAKAFEQVNPGLDGKRKMPPELKWDQTGLKVRLRLDLGSSRAALKKVMLALDLREDDWVVIANRFTVDSRKPENDQIKFAPTVRQLLHGTPGVISKIWQDVDGHGQPVGFVDVAMSRSSFGGAPGFMFNQMQRPFADGEQYTIDESANDINGSWVRIIVDGLVEGEPNALYDRLDGVAQSAIAQTEAGRDGQARFLEGLSRLEALGDFHALELSKQHYIGELGDVPLVLVQGPPGTGKSFTTAFALLARMQGAMAEERPFRAVIACKTHAATDVLLENVFEAQADLKLIRRRHPVLFAAYFDERLLDAVLFRLQPREAMPAGIVALNNPVKGEPRVLQRIMSAPWCVVASTPGRIYKTLKDREKQDGLFTQRFADCLVLDEASQMSLPEAIMAALPLKNDGQAIIVGDHRQMPPIVQHNWLHETRRTFQEFRAFESVFVALRDRTPKDHWIQFAESFRVHRDMAEFLRREIYEFDNIPYFSRKHAVLELCGSDDPFVCAVLTPAAPLVVVVHDEMASQVRNEFEQRLISPILRTLAAPDGLNLEAKDGLGVVVPHKAQRSALREGEPCLEQRDHVTGKVIGSAVDTVERFQGGEREVILISATESDRQYLLINGEFLLDPRRLTVALSRAKRKLILVASRSIFELFSADDETFANAQIWKNLLRQTCTSVLWEGEREGRRVVVHGNVPK